MRSFAALSLAAPGGCCTSKRQVPHYLTHLPRVNGFYLIANVTDPTKDFTPSVSGWYSAGLTSAPV